MVFVGDQSPASLKKIDPPQQVLPEARPATVVKENGAGDAVGPVSSRVAGLRSESALPVKPVSPVPVTEASLQVDLRIVSTEDLVVIASLGDGVSSATQDALFAAICQLLKCWSGSDAVQSVSWPVFANRRVPGADDSGLERLLSARLHPFASRPWLGIGPEMGAIFGSLDRDSTSGLGARVLYELSLAELACSGSAKRELWHAISESAISHQIRR
ncbi:hypothetical protein [Hydrocarboniclastica marina]|nr:hypothetical protein [Hydrocarboniclastica marina]